MAWLTVVGGAAGAATVVFALLDEGRRRRASRALRGVKEQAVSRARQLRTRASGAWGAAGEQLRARSHQASGQAGELAGKARTLAHRAQDRLKASSATSVRGQRRAGAAAILLARGALGHGLARFPYSLAGLSLASRMVRDAPPVRRGVGRATALARGATGRLRRVRIARAGDPSHRAPGGADEERDVYGLATGWHGGDGGGRSASPDLVSSEAVMPDADPAEDDVDVDAPRRPSAAGEPAQHLATPDSGGAAPREDPSLDGG